MIVKPFGPGIYSNNIDEEFFIFLKTLSTNQRNNIIPVGNRLVGNIKNQSLFLIPADKQNYFIKKITNYIFLYIKEMFEENKLNFEIDRKSITFNIGQGPWINYQKSGEFNPMHNHTGTLSCVIYINVPEEISQEKEEMKSISSNPVPGHIEFFFGDIGFLYGSQHRILPKNGDILIFPSNLYHTVYPFNSNGERISISFNVYNLLYNSKQII